MSTARVAALFLGVTVVTVAACGGAATAPTTAPTSTAAPTTTPTAASTTAPAPTQSGDVYSYIADLKSANEVPPIADAEAACAGQAKIALTVVVDPYYYNVVSGKATFDVTLTGCP